MTNFLFRIGDRVQHFDSPKKGTVVRRKESQDIDSCTAPFQPLYEVNWDDKYFIGNEAVFGFGTFFEPEASLKVVASDPLIDKANTMIESWTEEELKQFAFDRLVDELREQQAIQDMADDFEERKADEDMLDY